MPDSPGQAGAYDSGSGVTATRPATRPRRTPARARDLSPGEWERMVQERSFLRPLSPPLPLHVMARQRAQEPPEPSASLPSGPRPA